MPDDRNFSQMVQDAINKLQHVLTGKLERDDKGIIIEKIEPHLEGALADVQAALAKMKPRIIE